MEQYDRLRALAEQLSMRGVKLTGLLGVATPDASETIACQPRPEDGDRLWFWASDGTPIAEADDEHLDDTVLLILGHLNRRAEEAAVVSS
ncbi:hypothetical protein [Actinomadura miaoliensis]|uniref:Immunity protein 35 domain-containing protein n=1 Tax=Actinomadura miaoliensis TaxID=430685 RepID=A0ABP7X4Y7_9ACTN